MADGGTINKVSVGPYEYNIEMNKQALVDVVYPVGSIYMSVNSTSPSTLFGGTWEQLKDRFLLGAGDTYTAGATGGEAEHSHNAGTLRANIGRIPEISNVFAEVYNDSDNPYSPNVYYTVSSNHWSTPGDSSSVKTAISGSTGNANNMPPYLVVYMWKRTA